jgi:AraC-like DNA-binding protein
MESSAFASLIARSRENVERSRELCLSSRALSARSQRLCIIPIAGASDAGDLDAPRAFQAPHANDGPPPASVARDRRIVLVIAHDPAVRSFIAEAIVPYHDALEAEDAVTGLQRIGSAPAVDVILGGCFIASEARAVTACATLARMLYESYPWMPVVMISDVPPTDLKADLLLTGVRAFAPKDFVAADLATLIGRVAREPGAAVPGEAKIKAIRQTFAVLENSVIDMPPLSELARLANMSRSHFSRTFHTVAGMTLRDYVRDLRLKRAEHLLRTSDKSLTYIATESGFYDLPHLDKAFRHRLGVSPRMFRVRHEAPSAA